MDSLHDELEKKLEDSNARPMCLPLNFLKAITCDFSAGFELGSGGYGVVYKGILRSGKIIAVKKLFGIHLVDLDDKTFRNGVSYLMEIKHQNVAQFIGYCAESSWELIPQPMGRNFWAEMPKRLLCFEYVCNKSLDKYISAPAYSVLEWEMRFEIIKGICNGLNFLHEQCCMIHLDLKPENILMDGTMMPKIADFGLSRIFGNQKSRIVAKTSVGSRGYMAQEYLIEGIVSMKADIFSLGVIIIEIITGRRDYPHFHPDNPQSTITSCQHFTEEVIGSWRNKFESASKCISMEKYNLQVKQCITIALNCVDPSMEKRPTANDIIQLLNAVEQIEANKEKVSLNRLSVDGDMDMLEHILDGRAEPTNLPFALLKNITDHFSEDRVIGQGGFARVYKGILPNRSVAVKRIRSNHTIDEKLFYREVDSLLTINHQNVVRFLGFCASTEQTAIKTEGSAHHLYAEKRERLLCFEYVSNGNLQNHITDELRGLEWNKRYQIIKGICEGLHYLHKEKHMYHMDLKPANILLDNNMMPIITDFGLSRLDEKSQTMSEDRHGTLGYCAPEYQRSGKMSFKSDMFSLGVIITELVNGDKGILNNNNNVLRRWRHRWKKSGKETTLAHQQVAKCIDIGLRCQQINPSQRPFIWDMIHDIREMESVYGKIGNSNTFGQISPYSEDDMLGIEPLELHFPFQLNEQISCSLQLTNETDSYIAFDIEKMSPLPYCAKPHKGIVPPQSKCNVDIQLQPQDKAPREMQCANVFVVRSTKVNDGFAVNDITTNMFIKKMVNIVDEVNLDVFFDAQLESELDVHPLEPCFFERNRLATTRSDVSFPKNLEDSDVNQIVLPQLPNKLGITCDLLEKKLQDLSATPVVLTVEFLKAITCDFSSELEVGRGRYAVVYKGTLQSGKTVAVKIFYEYLENDKFQKEVSYLMAIKHQNIVHFLGYCAESSWKTKEPSSDHERIMWDETQKRLLCYEYVYNKSLNHYISDESSGLEWNIRYKIIKGICNGLHFLHEECRIIHLNLKPGHILIDTTMMPKITDFGYSRMLGREQSRIVTDNRATTSGYMAPEYSTQGVITMKADIFGLGVIIIEIITGHQYYPCIPEADPNPESTATSCQHFIEKVLGSWRNKFKSTPKCISVQTYIQQVRQCITIALKCVDYNMKRRPRTKDIVQMLNAAD